MPPQFGGTPGGCWKCPLCCMWDREGLRIWQVLFLSEGGLCVNGDSLKVVLALPGVAHHCWRHAWCPGQPRAKSGRSLNSSQSPWHRWPGAQGLCRLQVSTRCTLSCDRTDRQTLCRGWAVQANEGRWCRSLPPSYPQTGRWQGAGGRLGGQVQGSHHSLQLGTAKGRQAGGSRAPLSSL